MCPSNLTVVSQSPTHRATRITFLPSSRVGTRTRVFPDPGPVCFPQHRTVSLHTTERTRPAAVPFELLLLSGQGQHSRSAPTLVPGGQKRTWYHHSKPERTGLSELHASEWGTPSKELWGNCSSSVGLWSQRLHETIRFHLSI